MNIAKRRSRFGARFLLVVCAALVVGAGCERDETVRGAGSIEVPVENLKFQPTPKGAAKVKSKTSRNY